MGTNEPKMSKKVNVREYAGRHETVKRTIQVLQDSDDEDGAMQNFKRRRQEQTFPLEKEDADYLSRFADNAISNTLSKFSSLELPEIQQTLNALSFRFTKRVKQIKTKQQYKTPFKHLPKAIGELESEIVSLTPSTKLLKRQLKQEQTALRADENYVKYLKRIETNLKKTDPSLHEWLKIDQNERISFHRYDAFTPNLRVDHNNSKDLKASLTKARAVQRLQRASAVRSVTKKVADVLSVPLTFDKTYVEAQKLLLASNAHK